MDREPETPPASEQPGEGIAELRRIVETRLQSDTEVARFAEERRKLIAERGIDSHLQRLFDVEPVR